MADATVWFDEVNLGVAAGRTNALKLTMQGCPATEGIASEGQGLRPFQQPLLIVRRRAKSTAFASVFEPYDDRPKEAGMEIMYRSPTIVFTFTLTLLLAGSLFAGSPDSKAIQPCEKNPFYWQYRGKPVLLVGGSDDDNLFQWTGSALTNHLNDMVAVGANFVRNTMSDRDEGGHWGPAPEGAALVYAFKKVGDTYGLNQWNDEYWNRLDNFLRETHKRQSFVQIELWDGWDFTDIVTDQIPAPLSLTWSVNPWNPLANSNLYPMRQSSRRRIGRGLNSPLC